MCGIAGIWSRGTGVVDPEEIIKMLAVQSHRGPEGSAFSRLDQDNLLLGFLALSFTDIQSGMQPLFNEDGTIALIYNGEIYDYQALREELISKGHSFYTRSDSEVLIHLYEEHGMEFLKKINGEFAFAIYDGRKGHLILARDPCGVKPLCYGIVDGKFYFSSEAKGVLTAKGISRNIDIDYLNSVGVGIPNSTITLFQGIKNLQPGHYLIVKRREMEIKKYWFPNFNKCTDPYEVALENVKFLLRKSVERRLEGNPPIALSLSSGIDSTIIAWLAGNINKSIPAFTLGFPGRFFDESKIAEVSAGYFGIRHYTVGVDVTDLAATFAKALWHTESATNSLSNAGRLITNTEIRRSGLKAVMGGESSDEVFGGYPFFVIEQLWQMQDMGIDVSRQINEFKNTERLSRRIFWDDPAGRSKHISPYGTHHLIYLRALNAGKLSKLCWTREVSSNSSASAAQLFETEVSPQSVNHLEAFDKSRLMARSVAASFVYPGLGDRIEMANSLEGRVPFLDKDLVEYVYTLPGEYFIDMHNLRGKKLLRDAFKSELPVKFEPPPKHTFMSPRFDEIYRTKAGRELIDHYLDHTLVKKYALVNLNTLRWTKWLWKTRAMPEQPGLYLDSLIGLMLSIQVLNESFIEKNPMDEINIRQFRSRIFELDNKTLMSKYTIPI